MKIGKPGRRVPRARTPFRRLQKQLSRGVRRATGVISAAGSGAAMIVGRAPVPVRTPAGGTSGATNPLQALPDSTLRWLAASSVGLGAGSFLAGAPRLVVAAGVAPALVMGAAMIARPIEPGVRPKAR
jgi:hypothetical protein